jgi:general stress protein CsbA
MSRTRKWLLAVVLFLIAANLFGGFVGGSPIVLMLDVVIVGIGGLILIYRGMKSSERARSDTKK